MRFFLVFFTLAFLTSCTTTPGPPSQKLLGNHGLSLQWIGWEEDEMGTATVRQTSEGTYAISGRQQAKEGNDFLSIEGTVSDVGPRFFTFEGTIVTQVSHIADGRPVVREGKQRFGIYGDRDYWRMENLNNPEDAVVDYIDLHFERP